MKALVESEWLPSASGRFTTEKDLVPIQWEAGWVPEPVWTFIYRHVYHAQTLYDAIQYTDGVWVRFWEQTATMFLQSINW
jgi:hypothetical protein